MITHYCIFNNDTATAVFSGSLNECSQTVRELATINPNTEYFICKIEPVSRHINVKRMDGPLPPNVIEFPTRRQLVM